MMLASSLDPLLHPVNSPAPTRDEDATSSEASSSRSPSPPPAPVEAPLQTRQKKDYRPKSTLHLKERKDMSWDERIVARGLMHEGYHEMKPLDFDRGPIPKHSNFDEHVWILTRALFAPALQQLSYWVFPNWKWHVAFAYPVYVLSFAAFAIMTVRHFDYWTSVYGTLDEKNIGRDRIPDHSLRQLAIGFLAFLVVRPLGEFLLKWDQNESPIDSFGWTTPIRYFFWLLTMDYFFYVYHRSCHENDYLWSIHQKHHTTKHPNPVLSIIADNYQEVIEIALVPLCATLLIPMNFHELYLLVCYTAFVEIFGHTGMRADWSLPITGPILRPFGCDLMIEDHDLHHRYGKSGRNYGKQTRFWDVLFGTTTAREEMRGLPGHRET